MKTRVAVGVAAWLGGVAAATAGAVVAVSLIGQGFSDSSVTPLNAEQVSHELAQLTPAPSDSAAQASPTPSPASAAASSPEPSSASASPAAAAVTTSSAASVNVRTLVSAGGSVIAECTGDAAYLTSWSPAQGYQVAEVRRGPAATAEALFKAGTVAVEVGVVCRNGVPTAEAHDADDGVGGDD
jgi:hypothetical protein